MEEKELNKNYYAIIPATVRYDNELTPNEKLLYGEITALCNEKGYCWATNSYFATLYNVQVQSVSRWLKHLKERGYLDIEIIYKEGTKEILNRVLTINTIPINKNDNTLLTKMLNPINKNVKENNTSNNTSINNKKINKKDLVSVALIAKEVINYLNLKIQSDYKHTTKSTQRKIQARLNEGFTLDDFKTVIDNKCVDWLNTDMEMYLRPSTLFGTKFESYLKRPKRDLDNLNLKIEEILNYFNNCCELNQEQFKVQKKFNISFENREAVRLIKQRLEEGNTVDDFKDVIFIKYLDFIENERLINNNKSNYLYQPETLFCSKNFAKYKNQYDVWVNDN